MDRLIALCFLAGVFFFVVLGFAVAVRKRPYRLPGRVTSPNPASLLVMHSQPERSNPRPHEDAKVEREELKEAA